jgi:hypothetical protein
VPTITSADCLVEVRSVDERKGSAVKASIAFGVAVALATVVGLLAGHMQLGSLIGVAIGSILWVCFDPRLEATTRAYWVEERRRLRAR